MYVFLEILMPSNAPKNAYYVFFSAPAVGRKSATTFSVQRDTGKAERELDSRLGCEMLPRGSRKASPVGYRIKTKRQTRQSGKRPEWRAKVANNLVKR